MEVYTHKLVYKRVLVVVKHTAYQLYQQLKLQGKAPKAVRWGRLRNRHMVHREAVNTVLSSFDKLGVKYTTVSREDLDRQHLEDVDLVVSVGGDGTALSASHYLSASVPLLGVNSDPCDEIDTSSGNMTDERRSYGALCMCDSTTLDEALPKVLYGIVKPSKRARLLTIVKSAFTETRLPPALNDILISHPCPAAVSRFRMGFSDRFAGMDTKAQSHFSLNIWSSGLWVSTATGSTGALKSAGGQIMSFDSREMQFFVREHLLDENSQDQVDEGHGMIPEGCVLKIRWNSQHGCIYVDGEHATHHLDLGDEVSITSLASPLFLFGSDK
eukprot:486439_1